MSGEEAFYDSYKEERDLILEYNQVTLDSATVMNIQGVPIDNLTRDQAVVKVMNMIEKKGVHQVLLLNPYKIKRIKTGADLKLVMDKAAMYLATGAGIKWASNMLRHPLKETISTLSFMMDIIRVSEMKEYTIFLVGAKPEIVERAYSNINKSFPKIRIIGRHGGYFNQKREIAIIEAIKKSEPDIIFVGFGFPKEDKWIYKLKKEIKKGVLIGVGGSFDIISGEIRKAPPYFMERELDWFYRIIIRPWRIGRLFRVIIFFIKVVIKRIFSK